MKIEMVEFISQFLHKISFVIFSGITGYILSLDWFGLFCKRQKGSEIVEKNTIKSFKKRSRSQKMVQSDGFLIGKEILTHIVFFSINSVIIMSYTPNFEKSEINSTLHHMNMSTMTKNFTVTKGTLNSIINEQV